MTDMVGIQKNSVVRNELDFLKPKSTFAVDDIYWGYIVRSTEGPGLAIVVAQVVSMFVGASMIAASLGMWIMPMTVFGADGAILRVMASIVLLAMAAMLLWFSSRGTLTELQIDTNLGEARLVIRNRAGKTTLLGRYGFDSIGGVFLDRRGGEGATALLMRYQNTSQTLFVATGSEADLIPLRDRMGRDMMVSGISAKT